MAALSPITAQQIQQVQTAKIALANLYPMLDQFSSNPTADKAFVTSSFQQLDGLEASLRTQLAAQ